MGGVQIIRKDRGGAKQGVKGMDRIFPTTSHRKKTLEHGQDLVTQPGHSEIASSTPYF